MRDATRLGLRILGSGIIALTASHLFVGRSAAIRSMDGHRPQRFQLSPRARIEAEVIHVDALADRRDASGKIVFVGSSSVVNGVDVAMIENIWKSEGFSRIPVNYGLTSFTAAELPFLKDVLLAPDVKLIVYAYNTFSFPDRYHPQAISVRWKTSEFLRSGQVSRLISPSFSIALPVAGEAMAALRFQNFIIETTALRARGIFATRESPYDYPENEPIRPVREKRFQLPTKIDRNDFLQGIYLDSDTDGETLGYRGLARFLELAARARVPVVLMHVPEPDFSYRFGVNVDRIDNHVARIASKFGVVVLPRLRSIEANDSLFRDDVHLHTLGRQRYSRWLAYAVPQTMRRHFGRTFQ